MNIDRTIQAQPAKPVTTQQQGEARVKANTPNTEAKTGLPGTQVTLNQHILQLKTDDSQDINTDRLAEIKAKMDAGELSLDSDKIASALVRDIFSFA